MVPKMSSVTSSPVTSPNATAASRKSIVQKSTGKSFNADSFTRSMASTACFNASLCREETK